MYWWINNCLFPVSPFKYGCNDCRQCTRSVYKYAILYWFQYIPWAGQMQWLDENYHRCPLQHIPAALAAVYQRCSFSSHSSLWRLWPKRQKIRQDKTKRKTEWDGNEAGREKKKILFNQNYVCVCQQVYAPWSSSGQGGSFLHDQHLL